MLTANDQVIYTALGNSAPFLSVAINNIKLESPFLVVMAFDSIKKKRSEKTVLTTEA